MKQQLTMQPERKEMLRNPAASSALESNSVVQATTHPLLRLQRTIGNQAVQRMVSARGTERQNRPNMNGFGPKAQTPTSSTALVLQRKCNCGGTVPTVASQESGEECAECQAKREATLQRRASDQVAPSETKTAPHIVHDVLRSQGQPLDADTRAFMEARFEQDFSQVRVHTNANAAESARAMNALAYTVGNDVVFGGGQYAPETREGKKLLGHELTHVVQQSHGSTNQKAQSAPADGLVSEAGGETEREAEMIASQVVAGDRVHVQEQTLPQPTRAENPKQINSYAEFQTKVFVRAYERLESNVQKLDEWRKYIDAQFDDVGLQAQIASLETARLFQSARTRGQEQAFAQWASERSPASRALQEGKMNGLINSGCEECHESNIVWNWNLAHEAEIRNLPTPAQSLARLAQYTELERFIKGEQSSAVSGQTTKPGGNIQTPTAPSTAPVPAAPVIVQPPVQSAAPPVNLQYPEVQPGLCGTLPEPDAKPQPAPFDARLWGTDTLVALQSVQRIGTILEPLGPTGYRILPGELFSTLYNRGPAALHSDVMNNIAARQGKYRQLQSLIVTGKVPYTELCPIVEELFGSATPDVQFMVATEIIQAQINEWILDKLMKIAGVALLLLSAIFPPSAILLAAGAGLALAQIGTGLRDTLRGYHYGLGAGAGVFSPEQEASADFLYTSGVINIGSGIISLGLSGLGGLQLARQASWRNALLAALAEERTGPLASGKFNPLPDGSYVAFHPVNPNLAIVLDGDQLTCEVFVEGEWHVLASQRSPWGPGAPPPGTLTWEEYAARWNPPAGGTGAPGALVPTRQPLLLGPGASITSGRLQLPGRTGLPLLTGPKLPVIPGAQEVILSPEQYQAALSHVFPSQYLDAVLQVVELIGQRAAQIAIANPRFVQACNNGNWKLAGTLFHSAAAQAVPAFANQLPPGFQIVAEETIQSGKGGSRFDLLITAPGVDWEIDWKTSGLSGLRSIPELEKHAAQYSLPQNVGRVLTAQESKSWVDFVRPLLPGVKWPR